MCKTCSKTKVKPKTTCWVIYEFIQFLWKCLSKTSIQFQLPTACNGWIWIVHPSHLLFSYTKIYIFKSMNIASVFEFSRLENIWLYLFYFNTWFLFSIIKIQIYWVNNLIIQTMIYSDLIKQWNVNKLICF